MARRVTGPIPGSQYCVIEANPLRKLLVIQNRHATDSAYVLLDGDSSQGGDSSSLIAAATVLLPLDTAVLSGEEAKVAIYANTPVTLSVQEG